jgi:hypothetical protein
VEPHPNVITSPRLLPHGPSQDLSQCQHMSHALLVISHLLLDWPQCMMFHHRLRLTGVIFNRRFSSFYPKKLVDEGRASKISRITASDRDFAIDSSAYTFRSVLSIHTLQAASGLFGFTTIHNSSQLRHPSCRFQKSTRSMAHRRPHRPPSLRGSPPSLGRLSSPMVNESGSRRRER